MKSWFWTGALIGLVMPFLIIIPDQLLPTRLWLILWPAGTAGMAMHRFGQTLWIRLAILAVMYVGNAVIYGLVACGLKSLRSSEPIRN
jgi:hypothetical protein